MDITKRRKWKPKFIYMITVVILITFLQGLSYSFFKQQSFSGLVVYDEYNCGCPRYGPPIIKEGNISLCSDWSTSRGKHQKVISYTVYGDPTNAKISKHYYGGIEGRLKEASLYYENWIVRLYHNASTDNQETNKLICQLYCSYPNFDPCQIKNLFKPKSWVTMKTSSQKFSRSLETKIVNLVYSFLIPEIEQKSLKETDNSQTSKDGNSTVDCKDSFSNLLIGKMWRFLPMGDDLVDDFLIRDVDSYILPREVEAVKQWQSNSTALIHTMRDHPSHNGFILAGLWGGSRRRGEEMMTSFLRQMISWPPREIWDYDQVMLLRVVWPQVLDSVLVHDSYHCQNPILRSRTSTEPFPTKRNGRLFVGWGPNRSKTEIYLIKACPKKCRPAEHQNWTLC